MEAIKIIQWNCRGLWEKAPELPYICDNQDFILLSETMLSKEKHIKIPGMELYRKDREDGNGGGVAIGIKKGINFEKPSLNNRIFNEEEFETVGIKIKGKNNTQIAIFSTYRPPRFYTKGNQWNKYINEILKAAGNSEIIIGGDLNAQSKEWGNHNNPSGEQLVNTLFNKDLVVINNKAPTYHNHLTGYSSPDVTMVSKNLVTHSNWKGTEDT